jgi:hypothetical protein
LRHGGHDVAKGKCPRRRGKPAHVHETTAKPLDLLMGVLPGNRLGTGIRLAQKEAIR